MQRHVLSVLGENEPGVLSRVAGLFSGRGFNIDSLNVAPTLEEGVSHMTITTYGDSQILEQIMKQLHKIVTVIKVMDFADMPAIEREMMFVKVQAEGPARSEILRTVEIFRCKVVDVSSSEMTIEATGVPTAVPEGMRLTRDAGRYVVVGQYTDAGSATVNPHLDLNQKHLEVRGCWGSDVGHLHRSVQVLDRYAHWFPWTELISAEYALPRAAEALADVEAQRVVKALVVPESTSD